MAYRGANSAPIGLHWGTSRGVFPAFVMLGSAVNTPANNIAVSFDGGNTWQACVVPDPGAAGWRGVAYVPSLGRAIAIAANAGATGVVESVDGITWTAIAGNNLTAGNWRRMVFSRVSNLLVTVGIGGVAGQRCATSPDGVVWTLRPTPNLGGATSNNWETIIELEGGRLLAFSGAAFNPNAIRSDDGGLTWVHAGAFPTGNESALNAVAGIGNYARVTGGATANVSDYFTVDGGNSWTEVDSNPPRLGQGVAVALRPDTGLVISCTTTGGGGKFSVPATSVPPPNLWAQVDATGLSNPSDGFWSEEWQKFIFANSTGIVHQSPTGGAGTWSNVNTGLINNTVTVLKAIPFGT